MFTVTENKEIAKNVFFQKIQAPRLARKRKAGQFLVIRKGEMSERIPLTIVDSDPAASLCSLLADAPGRSSSVRCR